MNAVGHIADILLWLAVGWLLFGQQWLEGRAKRRADERAAARKAEWNELEEAIAEFEHWQRYGRGKPYRYGSLERLMADYRTRLGLTT